MKQYHTKITQNANAMRDLIIVQLIHLNRNEFSTNIIQNKHTYWQHNNSILGNELTYPSQLYTFNSNFLPKKRNKALFISVQSKQEAKLYQSKSRLIDLRKANWDRKY